MSDRYVRDVVKRYAGKACLNKGLLPTHLEAFIRQDLLRYNKNNHLVQKALGHVSISSTMIYKKIFYEQLEQALRSFRD